MNKAFGAVAVILSLIMVVAIAIVFALGFLSTVFLSLRSPEVKVPDVMGKDRFEAERVLGDAGLNFRVRATRPSSQVKADTVLFQVPKGGEVVKAGQTVAMDISRTVKEGDSSDISAPEKSPEEKPANAQANTNDSALANENKPKRPKNTNKNANENANANAATANGNANRAATTNRNSSNNTNNGANVNSNRPAANGNSNRVVTPNVNSRPAVSKPTPTVRPN